MCIMKEVVEKLIKSGKILSVMESCTGGAVTSAITNIDGASKILEFSAVTYSNEFKIKMGVSKEVIEKYSVYSSEVAKEMSKSISFFTNSDYGIGITGKLNKADINNHYGKNNSYINEQQEVNELYRKDNKKLVIEKVEKLLLKSI